MIREAGFGVGLWTGVLKCLRVGAKSAKVVFAKLFESFAPLAVNYSDREGSSCLDLFTALGCKSAECIPLPSDHY
jgi:hypothetical protein